MKRIFTKEELEGAFAVTKSKVKAAKRLKTSPKTFRKYWNELGCKETKQTKSSKFADPAVEALVKEFYDAKAQAPKTIREKLVLETLVKIEGNEAMKRTIDQDIQSLQNALYKMTLEG